ncbi:C40 family peptidase [Metabacillus sp. 84]|uniref:C40 family peptidase n=1 Tax=unclassified Metabacillus TaxID=2675274 RepID=UPI003CF9BB72
MNKKSIAAILIGASLAVTLPVLNSSKAESSLIETALQLQGTSYSEKGNTPSAGFNSAGFVQYVFKQSKGIELPRLSSEQWSFGTEVDRKSLQPGDVLFFKDSAGDKLITTALYEGKGKMVYSSVSKGVVSISFSRSDYWNSRYAGARRITEPLKTADHPVINEGLNHLDIPYIHGGQTPAGFDCSGYTKYVFEKAAGIYLPETPEQQWAVGETVEIENILPGDLVFFKNTHRPGISHVGIYAGNNQILNATQIGGANKVTISYLSSSYLQEKSAGVKRVDGLQIDRSHPLVKAAESLIGSPYKKGGTDPETGFDTGGFTQYVFKAAGKELPRYGRQQIQSGEEVEERELRPGDLVFFQADSIIPAIYAGNGQVIVASSEGVKAVHYKESSYWSGKFIKAKRI